MKATIASIVALLAMVANAGPFSYEIGQKIEGEPAGVTYDTGNSYRIMLNPPPPFEELAAFYTEEAGACAVLANKDVPFFIDDESGAEHRDMADGLARWITARLSGSAYSSKTTSCLALISWTLGWCWLKA